MDPTINRDCRAEGRDWLHAVSVVIPVYNRADWIAGAVESALEQTLSPCEVIVVDDGSTDQTSAVCRKMEDQIRYVRQSNQGVSAARNRGARLANGEWIAFLDSDDRWKPDKLEKQVRALCLHGRARWSICDGQLDGTGTHSTAFQEGFPLVSESGTAGRGWFEEYLDSVGRSRDSGGHGGEDRFEVFRGDLFPILLRGNLVQTSGLVVESDLFRDIGGFDEDLSVTEDYDLALRIAARDEECVVIAAPLYTWTLGDHDSLTSGRNTRDLIENALSCLERACGNRGELTEEEKEACREGRRDLYRRLAYYHLTEVRLDEARGAVRTAVQEGLSPDAATMAIYAATLLPEWGLRGLRRAKRKLG